MPRPRMLASLTSLIGLGCYTYVPATVESIPLGAEVRGIVSTEAQLALRDSLGLELSALNGRLVERDQDRLLFTVRSTDGGAAGSPLYQRVALAPRDVLRVDIKKLHRARTLALVAVGTAVVTLIALEGLGGNPGDPSNGGGGPPEHRMPVWFRR